MNQFVKILVVASLVFSQPFAAYSHKDTLGGAFFFIENIGQWTNDFFYKTRINDNNLYFHKDRIRIDIADHEKIDNIMHFKFLSAEEKKIRKQPDTKVNHHCYDLIFLNSHTQEIIPTNKIHTYFNYYIGKDKKQWKSNVKAWNKITYKNLYNNIDCSIFEKNGLLKYEFYVKPNANENDILIKYQGIDNVSIKDDNLILQTSVGKIVELKPIAWQINKSDTEYVSCKFSVKGNEVKFTFPQGYDRNRDLVIDPTLIFSTYSGSNADNWGYTATFDNAGNVYAGGNIFAIGYPTTTGAYQQTYGGNVDIVISKYNAEGSLLHYSTYIGGSGADVPNSLIVNSADELYVLATTGSVDYPCVAPCFDSTFNGGSPYILTNVINYNYGSDIAISCLNSSGTALIASTYLGGTSNDGFNMSAVLKYNYADDVRGEILLDSNSNVYIVSSTASSNFPSTSNSFQQTYGGGGQDGCITKFDRPLANLLWSSFLGGSGDDAIYSISLKNDKQIYIAGGTNSTNFPTSANAIYQTFQGGQADGFICNIRDNGSQLFASTYWGTNAYDQIFFVENDRESNVYILGQSKSTGNILINNATWNKPGGGQFISKINSTLTTCLWSTRFGTGNGVTDLSPTAFLVDYCNNIYLSAWGSPLLNGFGGTAGLPITIDAFQTTTDNNDYYFLSIKDDASDIVYGSYFGGSSSEHVDGGTSRFDRMGRIYQSVCAGCGGYDDFPTTTNAWSNTNNSLNCNNGVIKMDFNLPAIIADFSLPSVICIPQIANFSNQSYFPNPATSTCFWDFGDGNSSTMNNPSYQYSSSGVYNVKLIVSDISSCNSADSITKQIIVLSNSIDTLEDVHICLGDYIQIGILPLSDNSVTYKWTPTLSLNNNIISNPTATPQLTTDYALEISNGYCTDTIYQKVKVFDLHVDAGNDTAICILNHKLTATAWGSENIKYQWSSNSSFTDTLNNNEFDNTANIFLTAPKQYYVKAYNDLCTTIDSVFVNFKSIGLLFTSEKPLCNGDCNGSISVSISNGIPEYQYQWNTGENSFSISNLCAGNYSVTVTDSQGCQASGEFILDQPQPISYSAIIKNTNCENSCSGNIVGNVVGGTSPAAFLWNTGQNSESLYNLCEDTYYVTITDANNCTIKDTFEIFVDYIYKFFDTWTNDDTIYQGQSTNLYATDLSIVNYSWTPTSTLSSATESTVEASPTETTTYFVTLDDGYGCKISDSVIVYVLDVLCYEPYIFIPNSFTPNGDGNNDILYVRSNYIEDLYFAIYDRWGEKVFETRNSAIGWDGTFRGDLLDPAVFDFYVEIKCFNKEKYFKKGNITLLR